MKESFKTTTMTSLGFIGPLKNLASPTNLIFCSGFRPPPPIILVWNFQVSGGLLPWYCLTNSKVPNLRSPSQLSKTSTSLLLTIWLTIKVACLLVRAIYFEASQPLPLTQRTNQLRFLMSFWLYEGYVFWEN